VGILCSFFREPLRSRFSVKLRPVVFSTILNPDHLFPFSHLYPPSLFFPPWGILTPRTRGLAHVLEQRCAPDHQILVLSPQFFLSMFSPGISFSLFLWVLSGVMSRFSSHFRYSVRTKPVFSCLPLAPHVSNTFGSNFGLLREFFNFAQVLSFFLQPFPSASWFNSCLRRLACTPDLLKQFLTANGYSMQESARICLWYNRQLRFLLLSARTAKRAIEYLFGGARCTMIAWAKDRFPLYENE